MESIKLMAKQAKRRLSTDFWRQCKEDIDYTALQASRQGKNARAVKAGLYSKVRRAISGKEEDAFYLKVKDFLDKNGETSDAIGRLIDREYLATLSYEDGQRYTMTIAEKYREALERYRTENF